MIKMDFYARLFGIEARNANRKKVVFSTFVKVTARNKTYAAHFGPRIGDYSSNYNATKRRELVELNRSVSTQFLRFLEFESNPESRGWLTSKITESVTNLVDSIKCEYRDLFGDYDKVFVKMFRNNLKNKKRRLPLHMTDMYHNSQLIVENFNTIDRG